MRARPPINSTVFLDASYVIALTNHKDKHHKEAMAVAAALRASNARLVTTYGVLLEIGNGLTKASHRPAAVSILSLIMSDSAIAIVPITDSLTERAFKLFSNRTDKEWGMTDCCSFIVMEDKGIRQSLTADEHFVQAGFEALLLTSGK